jgi:predicted alpha/beta superfamily hydrolase
VSTTPPEINQPENNPAPADHLPGETSSETITASASPGLVDEQSRLVLHHQFKSHILPNDRDILVYVPEGYDDGSRRYPVLYLHDGQNLFDSTTAYIPGKAWHVHETADALIAAGEIEPLIIVGIYNTGKHRIDEYTPTANGKLGGGQAYLYGRMLIEEVKPMIDSTYRTQPARETTGLGGSSLGGLVTLYLGLERPDVFGKLAVLSPSVWWDHKIILSFVNEAMPRPDLKIWLDMGTKEGKNGLKDSDMLFRLLKERGWRDGNDLMYTRVPGGTHDETAWAGRVAPFLKFLFPPSTPPSTQG